MALKGAAEAAETGEILMRKLMIAAAGLGACMLATPAMAETDNPHSGFYAGGGINLYFIDKGDAASGLPIYFEDQPSPGAFMGRIGYAFNQYVAIEAEVGIGGARSDIEGPGISGDIGVSTPVAAFVALFVPFEGGAYLMGKGGYSSVTVDREINGVDYPDLDVNGAAFGFGGGFRSAKWDFRAEYSFISGDASSGVLGMFIMHRF